MVIDEIQRVPQLLLAIKEQVDTDPRPGRYLLSGSAQVLALRGLPDTLPGRIETIELWPFSQGEIDGTADKFGHAIFDHGGELSHESAVSSRIMPNGSSVAASPRRHWPAPTRLVASASSTSPTWPISCRPRGQPAVRDRAHRRDAGADRSAGLPGPAQLRVATAVGSDAGLTASTVYRYLGLLEEVFLVKRIPAWSQQR